MLSLCQNGTKQHLDASETTEAIENTGAEGGVGAESSTAALPERSNVAVRRKRSPQNVSFRRGRWRSCVTTLERFEQKVIPEPMSGCHLWIGAAKPGGYGNFAMGHGEFEVAHRAAWILYRGPIPDGLLVRHKCDLPACVNPNHLELGTTRDNIDDKMRRGRSRGGTVIGEKNNKAKLTARTALEVFDLIRTGAMTPTEIGRQYGICHGSVTAILVGKNWRHVTRVAANVARWSRAKHLRPGAGVGSLSDASRPISCAVPSPTEAR